MKTQFLSSKLKKKSMNYFFFNGPTDTFNFNQALSKHLDDNVFCNLNFFGANMSCEHKKRKKLPGLTKKTVFCFKKPRKNPFSSIFWTFKFRALWKVTFPPLSEFKKNQKTIHPTPHMYAGRCLHSKLNFLLCIFFQSSKKKSFCVNKIELYSNFQFPVLWHLPGRHLPGVTFARKTFARIREIDVRAKMSSGQKCRPGKWRPGKCLSGQTSFRANVFRANVIEPISRSKFRL
jgi:hypothetical protein